MPVGVRAEVGEWTKGGVCGVMHICGLQRNTEKKKGAGEELDVTSGPMMLFGGFALSELYRHHE